MKNKVIINRAFFIGFIISMIAFKLPIYWIIIPFVLEVVNNVSSKYIFKSKRRHSTVLDKNQQNENMKRLSYAVMFVYGGLVVGFLVIVLSYALL